MTNNFAYV